MFIGILYIVFFFQIKLFLGKLLFCTKNVRMIILFTNVLLVLVY
jgi:hypothetical protein